MTIKKERVCWVVTGAGHFLREAAEILESLPRACTVDLFFTRAAREVAACYGLRERLERAAEQSYYEGDYSAGHSIYFSSGRYRTLVIAPATANTTAKCALGIADSLASNFFAQAGKSGVPIIILPTDAESEILSVTPSGKTISVTPRPVDLLRTAELSDARAFPGVSVALSAKSLARLCASFTPCAETDSQELSETETP